MAKVPAEQLVDRRPLNLEYGGRLRQIQIEYETWGRLSAKRDNAILICPAFSATSHARSHEGNPEPGWWEGMIGPGMAFDTSQYFVVCSSLLGGWAGTTGPLSPDPETGRPYAGNFPTITIRDLIDVQVRLLDHLGLEKVEAAAGGSLGAMETMDLAVRYASRVQRVFALSGTEKTRPYTATIRHVGRRAIMLDPAFQGGFYGDQIPRQGLKLAREIGTIFYRSRMDFNTRFSCEPLDVPTLRGISFDFQSYLDHMGNKILARFDANSYLRLSMAMDLHDISRGLESMDEAVQRITARVFVMGVQQDPLIPIDEQREFHERLLKHGKCSEWHCLSSRFGHDAFLKEFDWLTPRVRAFLQAM